MAADEALLGEVREDALQGSARKVCENEEIKVDEKGDWKRSQAGDAHKTGRSCGKMQDRLEKIDERYVG